MIITQCRPGRRCRKWRECEACARIRQAQIADVAETGARSSPRITYAVARTYGPATVGADREQLIARLAKITEGGIWTIEAGEVSAGLHVNIIAGTLDGLTAAQIARAWPATTNADIWAQDVPRDQVRHVAAYVSKLDQMPSADEYAGRLYGAWGAWRRPLATLAEESRDAPILAGAAIEAMLTAAGIPAAEEADQVDHMSRMHAVASGETDMHGYGYATGYGLVTLGEARRMGRK